MKTNDNLLGTVIYEPNNQKALLLKDMKTNQQHEYAIDKVFNVEYEGKNYPLLNLLSEKNLNILKSAARSNEPTSFMLSKSELGKMQEKNIVPDMLSSKEKQEINVNESEVEKLKKELATVKNENQSLKQENQGLQSKFNIVERFFHQDKTVLKSFNQFLVNDKKIDLPEENENKKTELAATKKANKGIEL